MHFYQTKSIHPTRPWRFYVALLGHLPVVLTLWSTCCMLTGCNTPSALTPYQLTPSGPATPAYMVSLHDLQLEYKQETFKQFFIERQAEAIWNRLRLCLAPAGIFGGIDETSIDQDTQISELLAGHIKPMQEELQAAIRLYIGHQKQLYLLSMQDLTEIALQDLLHYNRLDAVWDRLQSAKNDSKDTVDLTGMLRGLKPIVKIHVLEQLIPWINKHLHVFELNLSGNSLTMLPESMGDLSNLLQLNLSYNNLTLLPAFIGNLNNLHSLHINGNGLTGLPDSIGNLSKLRNLNLSCNNLTELPACIGNLPNLRDLNLSCNNLTELPACIGNLPKLRDLNVSRNNLTELPACIENLEKLHCLDVSSNELTLLPKFIGNLSKLRYINLLHNDLTELPTCIENLSKLRCLDVSHNDLTVLPGSLQKLPRLSDFSVYCNPLVEPDSCQGMGALLTSSNLPTILFPSLKELAFQYIVYKKIPYNTTGHITLPDDCFNFKTYPVMLFTTQLGEVALSQPIPIITKLSYKQIRDYLSTGSQVILIQ